MDRPPQRTTRGFDQYSELPGGASPYTPGSEEFFISPNSPPGSSRKVFPYDDYPAADTLPPHPAYGPSPMTSPEMPKSQFQPGFTRRTSAMLKKWSTGVHWYTPTAMTVVFLLGVAGAVGHHSFYSGLHGRPASNQIMMNRYGTALAFFTKAMLVGSIVLAYRQRLWQTVRHKSISLRGLDALFAVVEDPSWFLFGSKEMLSKARIATFMAAATWLIPIASVIAPGSLTAQLVQVQISNAQCVVGTLNFTREATANYLKPRHGRAGYQLGYFNTTPPPEVRQEQENRVIWYDEPSKHARRLTTMSVYSAKPITERFPFSIRKPPCPDYNCTYTVRFHGPWYNCTRKDFGDSPFNGSDFSPTSRPKEENGKNYVYATKFTNAGGQVYEEYKKPQPDFNNKEWKSQGVLIGEPIVWFGYVVQSTEPRGGRWNHRLDQNALRCVHQRALYTVKTNFYDDKIFSREATVSEGKDLVKDGERIVPDKGEAGNAYKEFASYRALSQLAREWLTGDIQQANSTDNPVTHSDISMTAILVDQGTSWPAKDFPKQFTKFYENIVMSLMSEPYLEIADTVKVECNKTRWENQYQFQARGLWIGYAIAIFIAFVSIIFGSISIARNGMCSDTTFSKIMVTTRNKILDDMVKAYPGVALGGDPCPNELHDTELRFGVLDYADEDMGDSSVKHTAFGLKEQTSFITRKHALDTGRSTTTNWVPGVGLGVIPSM